MKKIVVDTSIWIEYFRGNEAAAALINNNTGYDLFITGPILTELIQGIKTESEKELFTNLMESYPRITILEHDWVDAGKTGSKLRKNGVTVPMADLLIYTVSINNSCALFTLDKHFGLINETIDSDLEIIDL